MFDKTMFKTLATLMCSTVLCQAADQMKAFSPAEPGMTRHVLNLPKAENEEALKVELIVGKTVKTDGVNHFFFTGSIVEETIQGWGFPRYMVHKVGPMAGTLMAPPPGAPKVDTFVTLRGTPQLLRYNSRLPLVVYVPEGFEVRYKIWRADPKAKPVEKG